ncbi:MG2 domain-containing protein [Engelhardtia mirabilis]|uniref:MG2 domain protein n=1 Tax=Engelhardtia mirabilis TaxID=2528011 RepID=A0A518BRH4_9BACT|nr:MG2 domain protein [Planctomycetes bacterium Pla133]QDV03900.1 MG2 domain protein [Planctomycetes bacterium Pla86]
MFRRIAIALALISTLVGLAALGLATPDPATRPLQWDLESQVRRAEALAAEGSDAAAHDVWRAIEAQAESGDLDLTDAQRRRLELGLADSGWRAAANTRDTSVIDAARETLRVLSPADTRVEDRDLVWAMARESLGDLDWARTRTWNIGPALADYTAALEWWGRSSDLERAREHWLSIFWRLAQPPWAPGDFDTGYGRGQIPIELAEQALRLVRGDDERGRAHLVLAHLGLQVASTPRQQARAIEHLEQVIAIGRATSAHDDALWALAQHLENVGRFTRDEEGRFELEVDLVGAVALYRQLRGDYSQDSSRWWNGANNRLGDLTGPSVQLWTPGAFLPGSQVGFGIQTRNVEAVEFALYPIDPARDVHFDASDQSPWSWLSEVDVKGRSPERAWSYATGDVGDYRRRDANLELDPAPELGAYVLVARAGGVEERELILVTDAALVTHAAASDLWLWATRATDGEPLGGVRFDVRARCRVDGGDWVWRERWATADGDGLARIDVGDARNTQILAFVSTDSGPAYSVLFSSARPDPAEWGLHVTTDRPAYRPGHEVYFSVMARVLSKDGTWEPPVGRAPRWEIYGPRGEVVASGELDLSTFGTASGSFATTVDQTLGAYQLRFLEGDRQIGQSELFRLEEYVRPEFEVSVELPEDDDGRAEVFVLGDEVRAEVVAATYAGAPVAGAEVEFVVRRQQHWSLPTPRGPYAWFERGLGQQNNNYWWGGSGEEVQRTSAVTDAAGRAQVAFETFGLDSGEWEFTVEARVTDALRREVTGTGTVLVAEHAFRARVETEHRLFRPGAALDATVITEDPNGNPLSVEGAASLVQVRSYTQVEWVDAFGPRIPTDLTFPHDVEQEIQRIPLTTGPDGRAQWTPTPPGVGTYLVRFEAADPRSGGRVVGEARVIVCTEGTNDVGLRSGGIELFLDAEAIAEGEAAQVLIVTDRSRRAVLLAVETRGELELRVLRIGGTAKLVALPLAERHVPQTYLSIFAVQDGQLLTDSETLVVPPAQHVLAIDAELDREVYEPGDVATLDLTVRDHAGEPVESHLSVTLFDESLTAIAAEASGDPRLTYFGQSSWWRASRATSFERNAYGRFELTDEFGWRSEREAQGYRGPGDTVGVQYETRKVRAGVGGREAGDSDFFLGQGIERLGYAESATPAMSRDMALAGPPGVQFFALAGAGTPTASVRVDFRETALWDADVVTDADGAAQLKFTWPDSTTRWKLGAVACDEHSSFGLERRSAARTTLPLLLRLATPRFLVAGDEAVVSTLVRNDTDAAIPCQVLLTTPIAGFDAAQIVGPLAGGVVDSEAGMVTVPAGAEVTVDWLVRAGGAGEAKFMAMVASSERSDGIERILPVIEHGLDVVIAAAGVADSERAELVVDLPPARPGSTAVDVVITPSLASTAIAALPYLADYPYGCLEQTLSRFVPTVVALGALEELGFDREAVARSTFDPPSHVRAPDTEREATLPKIDAMVADGLERVLSMQRGDGGFSWWPGGSADAFMTGYAVWSLALALDAGVDVPRGAIENGARWLEQRLVQTEADTQLGAWELHAWAAARRSLEDAGGAKLQISEAVGRAFDLTYSGRQSLGAYGLAALLLAAHDLGRDEQAAVLLRNLADGVVREDGSGGVLQPGIAASGRLTAHWGDDGIGYRWSQDGTEATAFALRALLAVDPDNALVEPAIEWLVLNRRGARWKSTRDTAICVLALVDAVRARGELEAPGEFRLLVDGTEIGGGSFDPSRPWIQPLRWPVSNLGEGRHVVALEQQGPPRRLYWHVTARTFSIEERIAPRANELVVRRDVFHLAPRETLLAGTVFERVPLAHGDVVASGDRVEVVVTLHTRVPLEYVIVEDHKAAGFEAVELTSGGPAWAQELRADEVAQRFGDDPLALPQTTGDRQPLAGVGYTGRSQWVYRELRDTRVVSFIDRLPAGTWELRTTLRAQTPGTFAALPATAAAMYAPDLAGNSIELQLGVE